MEAAVSSSLGAMGPVLRKLDLLLAPESWLRKRVKDGIRLLKQDLEEVSSALLDLSMLETPNPRAKCWMEEARELSYHVEDFIDELTLMRTDAGSKIRAASRHRVGRVKISLLPEPPRRSTRIAKIAQLRDLLLQATERLERYQLDACCSTPNHMNMITQHRRVPALYGDAANLVGIEDSRTKLIDMLTGEAEQQLKVVSIVGPAGVGKTTLAKEIFRELRGQFELRAFVHASRKIDMRRLLGSILSQVQPHHQLPSVAGSVQSLIDIIQEQLRHKRYLIVIDDLWEETAWDIVRGTFPQGNNCSRIVATTENMNVALKCCGYMAHNILKMKPLGIQDAGYLFFNRVFGSEQQCPDELKEVSYGIIRKCFGLPLSLIHVAGLLASIDYSELWYHVHDCLCSILNRSHTAEEIQKKILNLSYNSLPRHLKTCLLYFSMYPEGYIMWKGHLVKQWIAEGFINAAGGKDREETAEGYFEELVNRGMVQPMKIVYNDEVLSCTVHHIIFDLINHNSKEEEFIAAIDYSQPITGLSTKAHRLSFRFSSAKYAKQPARITMSQLRSLGFFGFIKCMPPIVEFKHLRVLVLDFWGSHDGHMSLNLSRICILLQLRYLKISGDIMVELPAQMQGLHYLETLEIDARLSAIPLDIVHLPSLLHLGLRAATKLPDGIGHIKSLSTLLYFDLGCNSEDNIWSLGQLTNLRHLHLTCSAVLSSGHLKRKLIPLAFSLGKLGNLKSLTLTPDALRTPILFDILSGISSPSIFLQRLELLPPICFFSRLPTRFDELHKLRILKIEVKELQGNDINNIAGLPSLVVFSLYVRAALTGTIIFRTMAFPALKYFKFTCGVMSLTFQAGTMPSLQRLKLCFNAYGGENHSRVLNGTEYLLNLQEVAVRIGVLPDADDFDWRAVKLLFEDTIRKHPRCPRFDSQLVHFIEEKDAPLNKFFLRRHEGSSSEHEIIERASTEDTDNIDSRLSREFNLPPASGTSYHHKPDEYGKHHVLISILRDDSAEPSTLDLSLLEDITNNFSTEQEIDQGGFGMVYKGILGDGIVTVKRLCEPRGTVDGELAHIVDCLMTVKHSNIVRFLGYWAQTQPNNIKKGGESLCIEQQDMLLCFEYLHNGSLRRHIAEESCGFEWHTRYQIMKGICQGLDYLHENHIIHMHLKPENILLDANMVPKIADYAYARLLGEDRPTATQEIVTLLDYMAPEYHEDGTISLKSDIYSLGVIIMQMVTGHKDHPNIKSVLGGWRSRLESDTSRRHTVLETAYRQVILCIEMGKSCMRHDPRKRPCIRDIVNRLAEMETSEGSSVISDVGLHQSILEGAYSNQQNHMRGAGATGPYDYSQSQEYHAESSSAAAATATRNSGTDEQIVSDFEYAKQLQQEMEDLYVEDDDDGDDISCVLCPSSDDKDDHHVEEEEADSQDGVGWSISILGWAIPPIISKLVNKGLSYLDDVAGSSADNLQNLEKKFGLLKLMLEAAEAVPPGGEKTELLERWVKDLKSAFYDADDLLDAIDYHRLYCKALLHHQSVNTTKQKQKAPPKKDFNVPNESKEELRETLKRIADLIDEGQKLLPLVHLTTSSDNIKSSPKQTMGSLSKSSQTTSEPPKVFGRDEDTKKIISMLHDTPADDHSVIGIHGIAGSGKTTLAQYVCDFEKKSEDHYFEIIMWIHVTENFSVHTVYSEMLQIASGHKMDSNLDMLQSELKKSLKGKRFLLVLDDVWYSESVDKQDDLKKLLSPLKEADKGSRVLVTSRTADAVKLLGAQSPMPISDMDEEEFFKMFMHYALDKSPVRDQDKGKFETIGKEISLLLQKSPLAARTVAGQLGLRTSRAEDIGFWIDTLNRKRDLLNDTMGALWWSYHQLEEHVRQCFAYCSMFPRRHTLFRDELVKMWMAQGFVDTSKNSDMEVAARECFEVLLSTSFIQLKPNGFYTVHDLLHDLAGIVAGSECFRIEKGMVDHQLPQDVRHLFIDSDNPREFIEQIVKLNNLRTLVMPNGAEKFFKTISAEDFKRILKDLKKLRFVHVHLEVWHANVIPECIGELKHLRYLGLWIKGYGTTDLPPAFAKLYHLQVLSIDSAVRCLDSSHMTDLENLRHMDCSTSNIPDIGRMRWLQTLGSFTVKKQEGYEITQLENLNNIRGRLIIEGLGNIQSKEEARRAKLSSKLHVSDLVLDWRSYLDEETESSSRKEQKTAAGHHPQVVTPEPEEILEALHPPALLAKLSIWNYGGSKLPSWLSGKDGMLNHLESLNFYHCRGSSQFRFSESLRNKLRSLHISDCSWDALPDNNKQLPSLEKLIIDSCPNIQSLPELPSSLKELWIDDCPNISTLPELPASLEELIIEVCPNIKTLPELPASLEELIIEVCPNIKTLPELPPSLEFLRCEKYLVDSYPDRQAIDRIEVEYFDDLDSETDDSME